MASSLSRQCKPCNRAACCSFARLLTWIQTSHSFCMYAYAHHCLAAASAVQCVYSSTGNTNNSFPPADLLTLVIKRPSWICQKCHVTLLCEVLFGFPFPPSPSLFPHPFPFAPLHFPSHSFPSHPFPPLPFPFARPQLLFPPLDPRPKPMTARQQAWCCQAQYK